MLEGCVIPETVFVFGVKPSTIGPDKYFSADLRIRSIITDESSGTTSIRLDPFGNWTSTIESHLARPDKNLVYSGILSNDGFTVAYDFFTIDDVGKQVPIWFAYEPPLGCVTASIARAGRC